jgi:hypothetical protein
VFEFLKGRFEGLSTDIPDETLGIPGPVEDLGFLMRVFERVFTVDLMIHQSDPASSGDLDAGSLSDLHLFRFRTADTSRDQLLVGVDQIFVGFHFEDTFIGRLDLEVAVSSGRFGVSNVEGSKAGFPEVGPENLAALTVVDSS